MKILFLTPRYPHVIDGGGLLKTKKLIDFFNINTNLTVVSLNTSITSIVKDANVVEFPLCELTYKPSFYNLLRSYFYRIPLSIVRNQSFEMVAELDKYLSWCDIVFVDHFIMFQYIPKDFSKRIYLHEHNAEFKIWERSSSNEKNLAKKILLLLESVRVKYYERSICRKSHLVFASPNDREALVDIGVPEPLLRNTYHLGDDSMIEQPDIIFSDSNKNLVFLGNLDWGPNLDGISWFLEDMWSTILDKHPDLVLNIVGKASDESAKYLKCFKNVKVHGFVNDLNTVLSQARVFIAPLRYGSGMKVKNITALYRGIPLVTTSVGAEGIKLENGVNSFIADDKCSFINRIFELIESDDLCISLSNNARALAKKNYLWSANLDLMLQEMNVHD
ncbi:glycosyltransferase family 4 protein [Vibrio vulnificus]|uniref:glycosyltransferase n=1 Tax=Vibrio vulnificus TaxID=672 RepID=UPI0028DF4EBD|nr:glycosyltransferase [Vibrio vulnificus]MDT8823875.1 glycosyltransferase family 4 protein [Vibrio vulnificus]